MEKDKKNSSDDIRYDFIPFKIKYNNVSIKSRSFKKLTLEKWKSLFKRFLSGRFDFD